ncbi:hypothetical protein FA95DRAFT_1611601 [Auriscalpium vulgare]|uniref:Uncharacterized protein n=1 Tax=Auriscalpium vulgare TaxID=40419 RepID=A0ACB8R940_9AGAM|nr:hypothetical protein FA95DRAFT_1611601 [Auriscalpium vulgare]
MAARLQPRDSLRSIDVALAGAGAVDIQYRPGRSARVATRMRFVALPDEDSVSNNQGLPDDSEDADAPEHSTATYATQGSADVPAAAATPASRASDPQTRANPLVDSHSQPSLVSQTPRRTASAALSHIEPSTPTPLSESQRPQRTASPASSHTEPSTPLGPVTRVPRSPPRRSSGHRPRRSPARSSPTSVNGPQPGSQTQFFGPEPFASPSPTPGCKRSRGGNLSN